MSDVRIVAVGDSALSVQFEARIDPVINAKVAACVAALSALPLAGLRDIVPAFRSVTVYFDPLVSDVDLLARTLRDAAARPGGDVIDPRRVIEIPVCYEREFGPDLDDVCLVSGLGVDQVIDIHSGTEYRVYMLGFVPGFAYLGSVDPRIATPRRPAPRTSVPRGSVGIAGSQTGIYPRQTAGGWNLIGRTPLPMTGADPLRPARLAAGDIVRFRRIGRTEFERLAESPA